MPLHGGAKQRAPADIPTHSQEDMSESIIILCPGQGAQHVGMGTAWHDASPVAAATFAEADDVLGIALSKLCFEGPEEDLNRTDIAQAALYTVSVASHRALVDRGEIGDVVAAAGLSLGEFTALHLAGAFDFAAGLQLVRLRGQAMQEAADTVESGMVALVGADEQQANELCDAARGDAVLVPANFNCPGQVVVSGAKAACDRALNIAEKMGLRATALAVAGAFHSPVMQPAADRLAQVIEDIAWQAPTVPVVSNVTAEPHDASDIASIKRHLVEQLTSPVRWSDSMRWSIDNVESNFVELAPGKVLSGLMRRIDRGMKVRNFSEPS